MSVIEGTFLVYKSAATLISKIGSAAAEPEGFQDSILNIDLSREEALLARYASPAILAFSVELGVGYRVIMDIFLEGVMLSTEQEKFSMRC